MTVRQALASLAARGLVERGVGRGTFVRGAGRRLEHDLSRVAGFTEQAERQGLEAGAEILAAAEQPAPPHVAEALAIEPGAPVVRIERVRSGDGCAVTLEDSWLPAERFPDLLAHDLAGSVYTLMRDVYGLAPVEAVERLEAVAARAHEAEALGVPEGAPLMLVERTAYAAGGMPGGVRARPPPRRPGALRRARRPRHPAGRRAAWRLSSPPCWPRWRPSSARRRASRSHSTAASRTATSASACAGATA